jgi:uncharacterized protein
MTDVTPLIPKGHQLIEAYGDGGFKVAGQDYSGSVLVFAEHTQPWPLHDWDVATEGDFDTVLQSEPLPELLVIGCGAHFQMLPKSLKQLFRRHGVPVEAMDTGAACRTYNVLLAEGRRVVAALIAV